MAKVKKKLSKAQTQAKLVRKQERINEAEWKRTVLERDQYTCQVTGQKNVPLNVHHILPRTIKEYKWISDNGIALSTYTHQWDKRISPHQNAVAFTEWLRENKPELYKIAMERIRKWVVLND